MFYLKICDHIYIYIYIYIYVFAMLPGPRLDRAAGLLLGTDERGPANSIDRLNVESMVLWARSSILIGLWNRSFCVHGRLS